MHRRNVIACLIIICSLVAGALSIDEGARAQENVALEGRISARRARGESPSEAREKDFVPGRVLVRFRREVSSHKAYASIARSSARSGAELSRLNVHVVELPGAGDEEAYLRHFLSLPEVASAELDRIVRPAQVSPNDPLYASSQWHLPKISAPSAWATTTGSSNVVVAVLDTGVDGAHPDLAGKLIAGWNVYNDNADTSDVHGHGTQVAGTVAAASNNALGVASVAWHCSIMPVRITNLAGSATYSSIASGLNWAADRGARVANVSFEATGSSTVRSAAEYFQSRGGVVVMAAGNNGYTDSSADNPFVVTVSATDQADSIYSWSNRGSVIDIAAPGVVHTTARGGGYTQAQGTSFSAPIVAGTAALAFSVNWNLTGEGVQEVLRRSAEELGAAGRDTLYGWGRVNAARAVSEAINYAGGGQDTAPPSIRITSPADGQFISNSITVYSDASDNVGVTKVELYINGKLSSTTTSAPFTTSWSTRRLKSGAYKLQTKAYDAAGNAGLSQVVTVWR